MKMGLYLIFEMSPEEIQVFNFSEIGEPLATIIEDSHGCYINSTDEENWSEEVRNFLINLSNGEMANYRVFGGEVRTAFQITEPSEVVIAGFLL